MNVHSFAMAAAMLLTFSPTLAVQPESRPQNENTLWYTSPIESAPATANKWMEYSLPIGNGQLGASITGGTATDEIQFNEKTLWSGSSVTGNDYGSYQNFGSVVVKALKGDFPVTGYRRALNLDSAMCSVSFVDASTGTRHVRQYFASFPAKCIVARYRATGREKLNLQITLKPGKPGIDADVKYADGEGSFSGKLDVISYCARVKVYAPGGETHTLPDCITVKDAEEVMIVTSGVTDFDPYSPQYISGTGKLNEKCRKTVNRAASQGWKRLLQKHLEDYMPLFSRMTLNLNAAANDIPTDMLVDTCEGGCKKYTNTLQQLYFAYGRYLEISSSRGVDLPSNLQGIWNNSSTPPWNSDIHSNINVQMNYWPAEPTNLSEMHLPFLNYIINMSTNHKEWAATAREAGVKHGWTVYTENNIMGGMGSFAHNYVIANAWYASHLWQHYRYTLDAAFLKRAFPAMWGAAAFWMERLKKAPDGTYECPDEYSPEHGPGENATAHSQQLVRQLLEDTRSAARILKGKCGVPGDSLQLLDSFIGNLDRGLRTEIYDGAWGTSEVAPGQPLLREWKYSPYSVGAPRHRHSSHLMCLYPLGQITPESPYFTAAVNSMKLRGDLSTGWSMGWKICLWARALNGNRAYGVLTNALRHSTSYGVDQNAGGVYYNLYDSHAPFQIDGNFGACAGIAEMLLQSYTDTLQLLPALPQAWPSGEVKGMKAVGNFCVSLSWTGGKISRAEIESIKGQKLYIKADDIQHARAYVGNRPALCRPVSAKTISVELKKGQRLTLEW